MKWRHITRFIHHTGFYRSFKSYNKETFIKDLIAGIVVGVVALPLSLAFGIASGVTPEKGLITAVIAGVVGTFVGGSRYLISGPTGAFIVITSGIVQKQGVEGLLIATAMAGVILILMGVLKLGKYIQFIPYPVVVGFNSGIALSIFTSQVKEFLGLNYHSTSTNFVDKWIEISANITSLNLWSIGLGIFTILLITLVPKLTRKIPSMLLAVVLVTIVAFVLKEWMDFSEIITVGEKFRIDTALPRVHRLSINFEYISDLLPAALTIAAMGAIVTLMTATVMDGATGEKHHSNTELISQGITNIFAPIFGGIPSTGAIARTMTNINTGGRTPIAGLIHGGLVLTILLFLGGLTELIPVACLSAMLVVVSYNMSDWRTFRALLRSPKQDVYVLLTTFSLTVLFDLTVAIEIGLLLAIFLFFKRVQDSVSISKMKEIIDPNLETDVEIHEDTVLLPKGIEAYEIDGPFFFGIANQFEEMTRVIGDKPKVRIIRMRKVPFIDSTAIHNLEILCKQMKKEKIQMILSGVNPKVLESITKTGFVNLIGEHNIFDNINSAVEYSKRYIQSELK